MLDILHDLNKFYRRYIWRPSLANITVNVVQQCTQNDKLRRIIPANVLMHLESLNPKQFKLYIQNELNAKERGHLMKFERLRKKTFSAEWPFSSQLSPGVLARQGFYSIDESDAVQCAFCDGILSCWNEDDDPAEQHKLHFDCEFDPRMARGRHLGNVLLLDEERIRFFIKKSEWPSLTLFARQRQDQETILSLNFNLDANLYDKPDRETRFTAFGATYIDIDAAAEAGFFGHITNILFGEPFAICHCCGVALSDFKENDDYWAEHARYSPFCHFLLRMKGKEYVDSVHNELRDKDEKAARYTAFQKKKMEQDRKQEKKMEGMTSVLMSLGFEKYVIDLAKKYKASYDSISDFIDGIRYVEANPLPSQGIEGIETSKEQATDVQALGHANCIMCEKVGINAMAEWVAISCRHLIFCDPCNKAEKEKVDSQPDYTALCPVESCKAPLLATCRYKI